MKIYKILTINPGSTSTKIAVFENENQVFIKNVKHSVELLQTFKTIAAQFEYRREAVLQELKDANIDIYDIDIIVGRGGLTYPIPSGCYEVTDKMIQDLTNPPQGEHACNLGGIISYDIAKKLHNVKAYIADPGVVDERCDYCKVSGHPLFKKISIFHALNTKAVARRYAKEIGRRYEDLNLILVHLGGGISIGAHQKGLVVDVNNALDGDGPFSPERSGSLPMGQLVSLCFSGKYSEKEIRQMITGKGGFVAYLGTNDAYELEKRCDAGDKEAIFYYGAMAYQVAKYIGAAAAALKGHVDAIILTGGIAKYKKFCHDVDEYVSFIAPMKVYPGEDEMLALASNGLMILNGEIKPKEYRVER